MNLKALSLHSVIRAKLNFRGRNIFYGRNGYMPEVDENGFTEFKLFDFMSIYGRCLIPGTVVPIASGNVYINADDLEDVDE